MRMVAKNAKQNKTHKTHSFVVKEKIAVVEHGYYGERYVRDCKAEVVYDEV